MSQLNPKTTSQNNQKVKFLNSFQMKMVVFMTITMFIVLISIIGVTSSNVTTSFDSNVENKFLEKTSLLSENIENMLSETLNELPIMTEAQDIKNMNSQAAQLYIELVLGEITGGESLSIVDKEGILIADTHQPSQIDLSKEQFFQQAIQGRRYIAGTPVISNSGKILLEIAVPIIQNENVIGVLKCDMNMDDIQEYLAASFQGETGEVYLVNHEGYLITPSRFESELVKSRNIQARSILEIKDSSHIVQNALAGHEMAEQYIDYMGVEVFGACSPLNILDSQWAIVVKQELREAFPETIKIVQDMIGVGYGCFLVAIFMIFFYTKSFVKPIRLVTDALVNLSLGKNNHDIAEEIEKKVLKRKDEIGVMGRTMNEVQNYLSEMGLEAHSIADGKLNINISPRSKEDELGIAFGEMINGLRNLIGGISESSILFAESSENLSKLANDTKLATSEIAQTIEQVASSSAQQTSSTIKTAEAME